MSGEGKFSRGRELFKDAAALVTDLATAPWRSHANIYRFMRNDGGSRAKAVGMALAMNPLTTVIPVAGIGLGGSVGRAAIITLGAQWTLGQLFSVNSAVATRVHPFPKIAARIEMRRQARQDKPGI